MSTVFTVERREEPINEFSFEKTAPPPISPPPVLTEPPPQALFGNSVLAGTETEPVTPDSDLNKIQSVYGNTVATRVAEARAATFEPVAVEFAQPAYQPPEVEEKQKTAERPVEAQQEAKKSEEKVEELKQAPSAAEERKEPEGPEKKSFKPQATETTATEEVEAGAKKRTAELRGATKQGEEAKQETAKQLQSKTGAATGEEEKPAKRAGGGEGGDGKEAEVAIAKGEPGAMLENLGAVPPSQAVVGLKTLRNVSADVFNEEHHELADNPPTMPRPSGLPRKLGEPKQELPEEEEQKPEQVEPEKIEQTKIETETPLTTAPLPVPEWVTNAIDSAPEEGEALEQTAWYTLVNMPTSDANVDTSAGPRPTVDLTGEADPKELNKQLDKNKSSFDGQYSGANAEIAQDYGENDIYPVVPEETLTGNFKTRRGARSKNKADQPKGIPQEGLDAFDIAAADQWSTAMSDAQSKNAEGENQRTIDEAAANNKAAVDIAKLEAEATTEQTLSQQQAKADVAAARQGWNDELAAADGVYTKKATELETNTRAQITKHKEEGDKEARTKLEEGERDANAAKLKAQQDAEKKRAEEKKSSGGFFGWVKGKIKGAINAIRSAINAIIDGMRKFVKWAIDKAKKLALWAIEKARAAIVSAIHAFGDLLELAADVFLAAFPKARKKFKQWIRKGVSTAEAAVNYAADKLKQGVCAVLDALGAALDFVLSVYQKFYNAILDAIEFVLIGLIEILEGIVRLGQSAAMVGDFFLGQVEEEGFGVDLTQPLPIEKTQKAQDIGQTAQTAVTIGAIQPQDASLFEKPKLSDSDAAATNVAQLRLDPVLLASIPPLREGEEFHFGYNDNPENQRDAVLASALSSQLTGQTPNGNGAAAATTGPAPNVEAGGAGGTAAENPALMTPEQQLVYLENQEVPHTCDAKKTEEPASSEALPEHMRIYGPFTPGQRFSYMWSQIKKGISQWWSCNWGKIVAAFAIGALVALLLGILTGGAIFAAIPPLLEILAAILIGVAVVRAASYIGDYLKLGWGGDLAGGGKALARACAILIIELIFALLFNIGSVIKALKSGLKGTVKAAAGAAKTAMKTTVKAVQELGAVGKTVFKAGVKNSKLLIAGFRNGFGEGIKTLGQLTREMLAKSRFRGFFFRLRGRMLQLWGRFNPPVLLGEHELTLEDVERHLAGIAKSGEKVAPSVRKEAQEITEAVAKSAGKLTEQLKTRVRQFFQQFKSQHVQDNPILAEVWQRALNKVSNRPKFAKYFEGGKLKPKVPDEIMKEMYAASRGEMDTALKSVVEELEAQFGKQLANRITELPANVQVHHLLYKSIVPELAVAKSNLILALRKSGSSLDELHDLFHLISAGGQGNRWRQLHNEIKELIKDIYKL